MKTACAFAGSDSNFNFFSRLSRGLKYNGFELMLLTCKPSLWMRAQISGIECAFVKNADTITEDGPSKSTTEVMSKEVNADDASRFYCGMMDSLLRVHKHNALSLVLIWNGNSIPTKAMSVFAQRNNIPSLYFELSNVPGKIFVDPKGVNAQSLLFQKPEILDRYSLDVQTFNEWRKHYVQYKRKETITPPAVRSRSIANYLFPLDSMAVKVFDLPEIGEMSLIQKIKSITNHPSSRFLFDRYDTVGKSFNLFPMQILTDSQLIFNSSISIYDALSIAYERSRKEQRDLVIKPHPVERDSTVFEYLETLKGREGLYIVADPTFTLVERCQEVITINSTVGLEGLIAGKKVTFLGASYYSSMNPERMMKYLLCYLVGVDYFSHEPISTVYVTEILSRIHIQ